MSKLKRKSEEEKKEGIQKSVCKDVLVKTLQKKIRSSRANTSAASDSVPCTPVGS